MKPVRSIIKKFYADTLKQNVKVLTRNYYAVRRGGYCVQWDEKDIRDTDFIHVRMAYVIKKKIEFLAAVDIDTRTNQIVHLQEWSQGKRFAPTLTWSAP